MGTGLDGEWELDWEREAAALFFNTLEILFVGGPDARLRKSTIFTYVELQVDQLSACENLFSPLGKTLFQAVYNSTF